MGRCPKPQGGSGQAVGSGRVQGRLGFERRLGLVGRVHQPELNPATNERRLLGPVAVSERETVIALDRDHQALVPIHVTGRSRCEELARISQRLDVHRGSD